MRHSLGLSDCSDEALPSAASLAAELDCFGAVAAAAAAAEYGQSDSAADAALGKPPATQGRLDKASQGWADGTSSRAPATPPLDALPLSGRQRATR